MDIQNIETGKKSIKKPKKKVLKKKKAMKTNKKVKKIKKVKKNEETKLEVKNIKVDKDDKLSNINTDKDDKFSDINKEDKPSDINTDKDDISEKEDKLFNSLDELNNTFNMIFSSLGKGSITRSSLKDVDKKYKLIQKNVLKFNNLIHGEYYRLITTVIKTKKKKMKRSNKNSGLQKKHLVDKKLLSFMNLEEGELVSRVDALRSISLYVKEHELQIPDRRVSFSIEGDLKILFPHLKELKYTQIMGELRNFFPKKETNKVNTLELELQA